jgi:hypothetical protein
MAFSNWILIISSAVIGVGFVISMLILRKNRVSVGEKIYGINPKSISSEGLQIPVLRTYSGLKALYPVTFVENKISPHLILYSDHLAYRVLRKRSFRYDMIERVDSYSSKYYNKLNFSFSNSGVFFMAVFANQETHKSVLDFLAKKGIYPQNKK